MAEVGTSGDPLQYGEGVIGEVQDGGGGNFVISKTPEKLNLREAARFLSDRLGRKVTSREVELLSVRCLGDSSGLVGRPRYFLAGELEKVTLKDVEAASSPVCGWISGYRVDSNRCGGKVYSLIVQEVGCFPLDKVIKLGDRFHPLSEDEVEEAKSSVGKVLPSLYCHNWREAK